MGAEATSCDTPMSLVNATFQWIKDNLKDEVDFVIWTGDSARHDNDERYPRTERQVVDQNTMLVNKFVEVFGKDDNINDTDPTNDFLVPIIPTFGNNDILPHNIFEPGPNKWTRKYLSIWDRFVPEEQRHSFARGGWFFVEVIRNKLAVFSLNTIYFFDANSAVDGCARKSEPGYEHMEWLRIQLQLLRIRGMKAIITGHVPPARTESKQGWDETCWQKYTLWMRQYRDVVVGAVYGHMNIDHFMIQDARDLEYDFLRELEGSWSPDRQKFNNTLSIRSKSEYLNELRQEWTDLPRPPAGSSYSITAGHLTEERMSKKKKSKKEKKRERFEKAIGGRWAERFSLSLVSPSVVPNYYPTLRVFEYNITGLQDSHPADHSPHVLASQGPPALLEQLDDMIELDGADLDEILVWGLEDQSDVHGLKKSKKKKKHKKKKPAKPPFNVPKAPSLSSPPGPAYSPQTFTWLSYAQYFANLTYINDNFDKDDNTHQEPKGEMRTLFRNKFTYELEYDTKLDKAYKMKDLTIRNYVDLAERIGRDKLVKKQLLSAEDVEMEEGDDVETERHGPHAFCAGQTEVAKKAMVMQKPKNKLWHAFVKRAFVLTKQDEELEEEFE